MYSALFLTETLTLVAGIFLCAPLIKRFGKRNIALAGSAIALVGQLLFFLNPYSFSWMVMSCVARAIGLAPLNAVVFGMVGDVVEYGQWKTHVDMGWHGSFQLKWNLIGTLRCHRVLNIYACFIVIELFPVLF